MFLRAEKEVLPQRGVFGWYSCRLENVSHWNTQRSRVAPALYCVGRERMQVLVIDGVLGD